MKYFDSEVRESFLSRLRNCISAFNNEDLVALKSQMLAQQGTANQAGSSGGNFSSLVNVFNHQMVQQFNAFHAGNSLTNLATTTPVTGPLSIDLDKLVYVLLEEYLSAKRKNELTFVEDFLKKLKSDKGKHLHKSSSCLIRGCADSLFWYLEEKGRLPRVRTRLHLSGIAHNPEGAALRNHKW